jgi:hypothetical protein
MKKSYKRQKYPQRFKTFYGKTKPVDYGRKKINDYDSKDSGVLIHSISFCFPMIIESLLIDKPVDDIFDNLVLPGEYQDNLSFCLGHGGIDWFYSRYHIGEIVVFKPQYTGHDYSEKWRCYPDEYSKTEVRCRVTDIRVAVDDRSGYKKQVIHIIYQTEPVIGKKK